MLLHLPLICPKKSLQTIDIIRKQNCSEKSLQAPANNSQEFTRSLVLSKQTMPPKLLELRENNDPACRNERNGDETKEDRPRFDNSCLT